MYRNCSDLNEEKAVKIIIFTKTSKCKVTNMSDQNNFKEWKKYPIIAKQYIYTK